MKINIVLKITIIIAAIIISFSVAYYYVIFLPNNSKINVSQDLKGTVIRVDNTEKFIVINLGQSAGIKNGMQMSVLREGAEIATVTVIETRKDIAAADIANVVSGFVIQEGDTVVSKIAKK